MFEQAWHWIAQTQLGVMRALSTALRDGSATTFALAFVLGALHALTPGHGKAVLAAYLLGKPSSIGKGMRIALSAASLHVFSGLVAFVIMRVMLKQMPLMTGRGPASITILGAGFVIAAGAMMIWQSMRPHRHDGANALAVGIGLLPCPLTVSVLGFAWLQSSVLMLVILVISLAAGIALTIGVVAVGAAIAQRLFGMALADRLDALTHGATVLQTLFGVVMVGLGLYMIVSLT